MKLTQWLQGCVVMGLLAAANLNAEQTLSIIKPDAVEKNHIGAIISRFETEGLQIDNIKMVRLTDEQARQFYAIHKGKPFYEELVKFMTSGPVVVMILDGDNAVLKNRMIMGSTDKNKNPGSIRADFAESLTRNAVHGSDSIENAKAEISFFFHGEEFLRP